MIEKENNNYQTFVNLTEMVENQFCDSIDEQDFFDYVDKFKIDLIDLQKKRKQIKLENIKKFNMFIYRCKTKLNIDIYTSLIYLEKRFIPFPKLLEILNETNKQILMREMSEKYKIKMPKNKLNDFISF